MFLECAGGLGNQLFVWNLAHLLECKYKEKIWIVYPGKTKARENELAVLKRHCSHNIGLIDENYIGHILRTKDRIARIAPVMKTVANNFMRIVELGEPEEVFDLNSLKARSIIRGFHQVSERVMQGLPLIAEELLTLTDYQYLNLILRENFNRQSLENIGHVRRGDFELLKDSYGILKENFYTEIAEMRKWSQFCIVTDSEYSIESEFGNISGLKILGPRDVSPWEALSVMSHAKELIIANSTLSWWGGILCKLRNGTVYAPEPWHLNSPYSSNYLKNDEFVYRSAEYKD